MSVRGFIKTIFLGSSDHEAGTGPVLTHDQVNKLSDGIEASLGYASAYEIRLLPVPTVIFIVRLNGSQGGVFEWVSDSVENEDGIGSPKSAGLVIKLDNVDVGRFRRVSTVSKPEFYGENDSDSIAAAIESKFSVQMKGNYLIESPINAVSSNKVIDAVGGSFVCKGLTPAQTALSLQGDDLTFIGGDWQGNCDSADTSTGSMFSFSGCDSLDLSRIKVSDTRQAAVRLVDIRNSHIHQNTLQNVGRDGYTDNHGIMLYTLDDDNTKNPIDMVTISNNSIYGTRRKSIATYTPGAVISNLSIINNVTSNSGLGGVYIGGVISGSSNTHRDINIAGHVSNNDYIGISLATTSGGNISGCLITDVQDRHGIELNAVENISVKSNVIQNIAQTGINVLNTIAANSHIVIDGNLIRDCNLSGIGYAPHINLSGAGNTSVVNNSLSGSSTHGIYEQVTSSGNLYRGNIIDTSEISSGVDINANDGSFVERMNSSGIVHESADISKEHVYSSTSNQIDDAVMPDTAGILRIEGATGGFQLRGISGGVVGRRLIVINDTGFTMNVVRGQASSLPANRIFSSQSSTSVSAGDSIEFIYSSIGGQSYWVMNNR